MKKIKIVLTSITLLGIAGSIVAFKATRNKTAPAYYTFQYNAQAFFTFPKASALQATPLTPGTVYYTLNKSAVARLYASLYTNA